MTTMIAPGLSIADANLGQFLGYELGKAYPRTADTRTQVITSGNLKLTAERPVKPADVGDVTLVVTPASLTVGLISTLTWFESEAEARDFGRRYSTLLRAKYPDWAFGREAMDASMRPVEVNLDKSPHNLRMRLTEGRRAGKTMWRVSMTLGWLPGTREAKAWDELSTAEQSDAEQQNRDRLLEHSDTRGL